MWIKHAKTCKHYSIRHTNYSITNKTALVINEYIMQKTAVTITLLYTQQISILHVHRNFRDMYIIL